LQGNTGSIPGNIVDNAAVIFDQGSSGTYFGTISGSGAFGKSGAGALTFAGPQFYTGGTIVSGGSLIGDTSSLHGVIVNNAGLTFAQTSDATFDGTLAGNGTISKSGAGVLTLAGTHPFTGLFSVDGGALNLNGTLNGSLIIGPAGTAAMNGAIAGNLQVSSQGSITTAGSVGGSVTVGGSLSIPAPGTAQSSFNSLRLHPLATAPTRDVPSLYVNGDFNATPGSTLNFTVTPDGAPPIVVNGKANINNTHLNIDVEDPNPARYANYIALTAGGGLSASGLTVGSLANGIVPVVRADPNALLVTVENFNIPLSTVPISPKVTSIAKAVDIGKLSGDPDFGKIARELTALSDSQLSAALQQLSGEVHASQARLASIDSASISDIVRGSLSDREDAAADTKSQTGAKQTKSKASPMWIEFAADHGSYADGTKSNMGGAAGGYDLKNSERVTAGVGLAFTQGSLALGDGGGTANLAAPRAMGYSGVGFGPFKIHAGGSASPTSNHSQRQIAFTAMVPDANGNLVPLTGGIDRTADTTQTGMNTDGWTEGKGSYKRSGWLFNATTGLRAARMNQHAFQETGAGSISLQGGDQVLKQKEVNLNVVGDRKIGVWRPHFELAYRREFSPTLTTADMQFAGQSDTDFTTQGLPIPVTEYKGEAAITYRGGFITWTATYRFSKSAEETHNSISFSAHFK
ncbi:MAG TPA: autotransporter domain-containing protein, partial [Vicinamibacterales bacterium]|nr:autotransporter domain-containing protein [Vicinamibacterales bacterium]